MTSWATPLLVLPGVGMLVLSTSVRYARIHDELHHLAEHRGRLARDTVACLLARGGLFRNALVSLYAAAAFLAFAGLVGGFGLPEAAAVSLSAGGVLALLAGCVVLIREAVLSFHVFEAEGRALYDAPDGLREAPEE